LYGTQR